MKLQKLVYIAHGWHLAITDGALIYERVEAWPYGPVIPDLYHALKHCGHAPIRERLTDVDLSTFDVVPASLLSGANPATDETQNIVNRVWSSYGPLTALQLSTMTHKPGTPWDTVAKQHNTKQPRGFVIEQELIRDHYRDLAAERRKARVG